MAALPPTSGVLEIGPGIGVTAAHIQEEYPGLKVTALSTKRTPAFSGITVLGGIGGLVTDDEVIFTQLRDRGPFGLIFAHNVLYNFPYPLRGLEAAYRLLADGGWLIVNMLQLTPQTAAQFKQEITQAGYSGRVSVSEQKDILDRPITNLEVALQKTLDHPNLVTSVRNAESPYG